MNTHGRGVRTPWQREPLVCLLVLLSSLLFIAVIRIVLLLSLTMFCYHLLLLLFVLLLELCCCYHCAYYCVAIITVACYVVFVAVIEFKLCASMFVVCVCFVCTLVRGVVFLELIWWHYLSKATCLMWTHLFSTALLV